jgi:hypothetical protein
MPRLHTARLLGNVAQRANAARHSERFGNGQRVKRRAADVNLANSRASQFSMESGSLYTAY